jgi:uncharacterized membrane protein
MKLPILNCSVHKWILAASLLGLLTATGELKAQQQPTKPPHYKVTDLGALPGSANYSQATFIDKKGLTSGYSTDAAGALHAVLWYNRAITDIAEREPAGQNSGAFGVNDLGQALLQADISVHDPLNEDFCAFFSGLECRPFLWQFGTMTELPLLGGNNGAVCIINDRGEAVGIVETGKKDTVCGALGNQQRNRTTVFGL